MGRGNWGSDLGGWGSPSPALPEMGRGNWGLDEVKGNWGNLDGDGDGAGGTRMEMEVGLED